MLKHLKNAYAEQIKMIYIDPPYNTGKDGFVYQDNRKFTVKELSALAGLEENEAKRILEFTNSNSSSHSAWLTFIYPRLYVAKELLNAEGVIFISIDDNEFSQLKMLCDEVFGSGNFVGNLVLQTATDNNPTQINTEHEYILCYALHSEGLDNWFSPSKPAAKIKEKYDSLKSEGLSDQDIQTKLRKWIKQNKADLPRVSHYDNVDANGVFHDGDIANTKFGGYDYVIPHPTTGKPCKVPGKGFRYPKSTLLEMIANDQVLFGKDHTTLIKPKKRVEDAKDLLRTMIYEDGRRSTKEVEALIGRGVFTDPKSHFILKRLISFVTSDDDYVLDFFAGSGTTAHAVMSLNADEGRTLRHMTVQLDEATSVDSEASKAGYNTIFEITRDRILKAAEKIKAQNPDASCNFGFKEFKTVPVFDGYLNEADTPDQYTIFEDEKLSDEQRAQLLLTWQVYDGLPLTLDLETVDLAGYTAHQGKHILYCINSGLTLDHTLKMLELIDTDNGFAPQKIVVFEYILSSKAKREIMETIKGYNNRKQIELHLEIRL